MALHTPLYDWHVAHKGRMVEFGGWQMPVQYAGIVAEHSAVRSAAGLFDISHMARFSIGGPEALALIDHAWTNDAAGMKDTQVRYGLVGNEQGGIVDDILVYRWSYGWTMVVNASNRKAVWDRLQTYAAGKDVQMQDQTESTGMLAVQGPKAVELLAGLFEADVAGLKYYYATATRCRGNQCVVSRTGYTGEDGFEVMLAADKVVELADEFVRRGAVCCGLGARDTLRLEAGMPLYGHELSMDIDPFQAGLGWAVKPAKGEFVGKEPMLAKKGDAARRKRVGLTLEPGRSAREGCGVVMAGKSVGTVTSGAPSPTLGRPIAMAYVDPAHAEVGTKLEVDIRGTTVPATVVALPFYQRPKK
ncbi:MAG: glycine cleavage system aminomethyltransferase GcvT [Gemmataceae bacterium]|nr:glycine cleavage system aminomethyltransferase GcvT [Gemmataceae bacterium]